MFMLWILTFGYEDFEHHSAINYRYKCLDSVAKWFNNNFKPIKWKLELIL